MVDLHVQVSQSTRELLRQDRVDLQTARVEDVLESLDGEPLGRGLRFDLQWWRVRDGQTGLWV